MSVHIIRPRRRRREEGIALVVVLLFTAVVLTIVVSTTATLALGARGGGVNERAAYQALLAAESGLNTFEARVKAAGKYMAANDAALSTWKQNNADLLTYGNADLLLTVKSPGQEITVESRGKALGGNKVVLMDFSVIAGDPIRFRPRSALTSMPEIDANGNATIVGTANQGIVTTVQGSAISLPITGTTVTLPVEDASSLLVGDYITVSGTTFRINEKDGNSLKLTRITPISTSISLSGDVNLMLNATAASYTALSSPAITSPMWLKASNSGDFLGGEQITIGNKKATVLTPTAAEETAGLPEGSIKIRWDDAAPTVLNEGTQIRRDIRAMRSSSDIDPKQNKLGAYDIDGIDDCVATGKKSSDCKGANDPLLKAIDTGDKFTQSLFGMTDQQLDEMVPVETPLPSDFQMNGEIRRIKASDLDAAIKNKNSSGILIVDGDVNSNFNGSTVFNGFIYFRGNQGGKFNGNLTINGGVAVRGGRIQGVTDVPTDITGSLNINYDAAKLRRYFIENARREMKAIQGTWRQR